jgi:glycerophosphoryl diester phosphodiesterase
MEEARYMNRKVWGHRGCRGAGNPPENSIGAFRYAVEAGAGGIELDVYLSEDGVPVVFHDDSLERMTGTAGKIKLLTLPEIKKLRLLSADGRPSKETIPTLAEVLDLVDRYRQSAPTFVVNIEIKDGASAAAVSALVSQRMGKDWKPKNFLISSFEMACLREMKSLLPDVPRGVLFECGAEGVASKIRETADIKPSTVNISMNALTPGVFAAIIAAGATPVVWTENETNPNRLPHAEREKLVKRLREQEFVCITDFPKELVHWLKPSKTRATVTGMLAACLALNQQDMLFHPTESGLEILKAPSDYPELQPFGFHELTVTAEDGISFVVWERKGAPGQPHYLLFHGNRAHWGDTGPGELKDRRARLKFISELARSGAGVTAVTLRGFGRSLEIPSEMGFLRDLRALAKYMADSGFNHERLVVAGESLGTWAATQTAVYMTQQNTPPAVLSLQNPFTSAAEVGEAVVSHFPFVKSFHISLSATSLDRHILKSHFYTANLLRELSDHTVLHIATSGRDELVDPSHSDRLAEIAGGKHLRVVRDVFADARHCTIPPIEYARRLICLGGQSCAPTAETHEARVDPPPSSETVNHAPYLS